MAFNKKTIRDVNIFVYVVDKDKTENVIRTR